MANRYLPTSSLNSSGKPSWPLSMFNKLFRQRIEPETYEQDQKITFDRYGIRYPVKTKAGRSVFGEFPDSQNQFVIRAPGAGNPINLTKAIANNKGFVYAAVNAKAREVMNIDWRLFQVDGEDHKEKTEHTLLDLLDSPNDNMTGFEFKYLLSACLDLTGNAYIFLEGVKSDMDEPKRLHLMPPDKVAPVIDRRQWPYQLVGYQMKLENSVTDMAFRPYEVVHLRLPNPGDFFEGYSPVAAGAEYIDNDNYAMEFNRKFFINGARPAGFLESDIVSEAQAEVLRISFANMHEGVDNMNRIGVLPKGVKWAPAGSSPKDMDFKSLSEDMRDRILAMFGVSRTILGTAESDTNRACYDDQTEVLTENGWKKYWEVKDGEKIAEYDGITDEVRFAVPLGKYVYHYQGKMLHFANNKMDIMVTPDHRMWYRPDHKGAKYRIERAEKLPTVAYFKAAAPQYDGEEVHYFSLPGYQKGSHPEYICRGFLMDDWLEFLGYVISEGGVSSQVRNRVITLYQKKQPHQDKIRACLKRLKNSGCLNFGEYQTPGEDGVRFNVYGAPLIFWMHENIGSYANEKRIPDFVFTLCRRQRQIIFDALMVGDGSIDSKPNAANGYYSSTSHQLADDVQRLAFSLGIQAHNGIHYEANGNRHTCYRVMFDFRMTEQLINGNRDGYRTEVDYDGMVWCFRTTTGLFVTRRNGRIALQGNTAETADYVFSKRVVKPHMQLICGFLNERLVPRYGDDLYITFIDPVPEDKQFRTQEMQAAVGNQPLMTANEGRENYLGLGPVDGGDTLMAPTAMQPVGAPSEPDDAKPQPENDPNSKALRKSFGMTKAANGERVAFRPVRTKLQTLAKKRNEQTGELTKTLQAVVLAALTQTRFSTKEQDAAVWKAVNERTEQAEQEIKEAVIKLNAAQKPEVMENLAGAVKAVDPKKLFDIDKWISITTDALTPILVDLYEHEGKAAAAELGRELNPLSDNAAKEALHNSIAKMSESYQKTTLETLEAKINDGLSAGKPLADIRASVSEIYEWSDTWRAERVARTESFRTTNMSLKSAWQQTGVVKSVRWYVVSDTPCEFCQQMDGKVIPIDSVFFKNGESMTAGEGDDSHVMTFDYGDVDSPPLHVQCRCVIRPQEVSIE